MYCTCSKNNIPVFYLNYERKNLALQVTVNNMNGDDAYEAKLVGTFPDVLSYSGVRSHQRVNLLLHLLLAHYINTRKKHLYWKHLLVLKWRDERLYNDHLKMCNASQ